MAPPFTTEGITTCTPQELQATVACEPVTIPEDRLVLQAQVPPGTAHASGQI